MLDLNILRRNLGLKKKKPIPYPAPSIEYMEQLGRTYENEYDRALFYLLYLGGQRITECLNTNKMAITTDSREGFEFIIINSITEKNRSQPRRTIPIPLYGKEKNMAEEVWRYIDRPGGGQLFPGLSRTNAWHRLSKASMDNLAIDPMNKIIEYKMKIFCHFQRHCRASHMVMFHGYDILKLMQYFGWSSPSVPTIYVMLDWVSLAGPMMKK